MDRSINTNEPLSDLPRLVDPPVACNPYFWVDPTKGLTGPILTQILRFAEANVLSLLEQFETAMYEPRIS